ncbi:hypothetical protein M514_01945 [Trichuris suis]|uniref:Uncharacterized protein n=1 Tax=Trichuris suis TaxID=68888 RepID=A0A085MIL4_9BILA|nr:hypothetical protein M513_01945 [Trichuris suis]KFD69580.1 hypothetical protein M514_01945 [Trichuris suis]
MKRGKNERHRVVIVNGVASLIMPLLQQMLICYWIIACWISAECNISHDINQQRLYSVFVNSNQGKPFSQEMKADSSNWISMRSIVPVSAIRAPH